MFSIYASIGISSYAGVVLLTSTPIFSSAQGLNFGIVDPLNSYLSPVSFIYPSSPKTNSVSLNPQPYYLNQSSLYVF